MSIRLRKKFLFELAKIPSTSRRSIEQFVFEDFPANPSIKFWDHISPIKSERNCFKIPFDQYRIAIKQENGAIIFERIRHKDDIYRL